MTAKIEPGSEPLANQRWEAFCRFYAAGDPRDGKHRGNATKAYASAGYNVADDASAGTAGNRLLQNVQIKQRVAWLSKKFWEKLDITSEELIARAAAIVRFDPAKLENGDGDYVPLTDVDEETRMALAGVEVTLMIPNATEANPNPQTIVTRKYKAADKNAAIRTLAQIKRMVGPEVSVTVNASMADRLAAARKRARERSGS